VAASPFPPSEREQELRRKKVLQHTEFMMSLYSKRGFSQRPFVQVHFVKAINYIVSFNSLDHVEETAAQQQEEAVGVVLLLPAGVLGLAADVDCEERGCARARSHSLPPL